MQIFWIVDLNLVTTRVGSWLWSQMAWYICTQKDNHRGVLLWGQDMYYQLANPANLVVPAWDFEALKKGSSDLVGIIWLCFWSVLGNLTFWLVKWSSVVVLLNTVTELADFGFTPHLWRLQGPHGCLEKQNCPLSLKVVVWCTIIGPKIKKIWKPSEMTRKTSESYGFLTLSAPNYQIGTQWKILLL